MGKVKPCEYFPDALYQDKFSHRVTDKRTERQHTESGTFWYLVEAGMTATAITLQTCGSNSRMKVVQNICIFPSVSILCYDNLADTLIFELTM